MFYNLTLPSSNETKSTGVTETLCAKLLTHRGSLHARNVNVLITFAHVKFTFECLNWNFCIGSTQSACINPGVFFQAGLSALKFGPV